MNPGLLGQVDLSPAPLLSKLSNSFAELDTYIWGHSSSIDLAETLYLVDALFLANFKLRTGFRSCHRPGCLLQRTGSGRISVADKNLTISSGRSRTMPTRRDLLKGWEKQ
jgi:hypothetical protein